MIKCNGFHSLCGKCVIDMDAQETMGGEICCDLAEDLEFEKDDILNKCQYADLTNTSEKSNLDDLAKKAFKAHKTSVETWKYGEPIKVWLDEEKNLCVQYTDGSWWHYKNLELPFPSWW